MNQLFQLNQKLDHISPSVSFIVEIVCALLLPDNLVFGYSSLFFISPWYSQEGTGKCLLHMGSHVLRSQCSAFNLRETQNTPINKHAGILKMKGAGNTPVLYFTNTSSLVKN